MKMTNKEIREINERITAEQIIKESCHDRF